MLLKLENFEGALPFANPRLIPDSVAQMAKSVDFSKRRLEAGYSLGSPTQPPFVADPIPYTLPDCAEYVTRSPVIEDEHNRYYYVCNFDLKSMSDKGERGVGTPVPEGEVTVNSIDNSHLFTTVTKEVEVPESALANPVTYAIENNLINPRAAKHVTTSEPTISNDANDQYEYIATYWESWDETHYDAESDSYIWRDVESYVTSQADLLDAGLITLDGCGTPISLPSGENIKAIGTSTNDRTAKPQTDANKSGVGSVFGAPSRWVVERRLIAASDQDAVENRHVITMTYPEYDESLIEEERYYAFSYVNDMGEEGALSVPLGIKGDDVVFDGTIVQLNVSPTNMFYANTERYDLRVYRAYDGEWRYVADFDLNSVQTKYSDGTTVDGYVDSLYNYQLGEVAPNLEWEEPPRNIKGLLRHTSGAMCVWKQNDLFFSVSYLPHAWPSNNRLSIEDNVIKALQTQNGIITLTSGSVYMIAGANPASVQPMRVDSYNPCLSEDSAVDMGDVVVYLSTDGLVKTDGYSVVPFARDALPKSLFESASTVKAARFKNYYAVTIDGKLYIVDARETAIFIADSVTGFDTTEDYDDALKLDDGRFLLIDRLGEFQWISKRIRVSPTRGFTSIKLIGQVHSPGNGLGSISIRGFVSNTESYQYQKEINLSDVFAEPITFDGERLPSGMYDEIEIEVNAEQGSGLIIDAILLGNSMSEVRNG